MIDEWPRVYARSFNIWTAPKATLDAAYPWYTLDMQIFVIGTLHLGLTPLDELKEVLEDISPDQILIELPRGTHGVGGPDEMVYAKQWARDNGINVDFFDADISVLKDSILENNAEYKELIKRQVQLLQGISWKDANKKATFTEGELAKIDKELMTKVFDVEKWNRREDEMLKNVVELMQKDGVVAILTGAGHLDFFENSPLETKLPLRYG